MPVGKVISTQDSPSPTFFAFAIAKGGKVHKDQFIKVKTEEGTMLAMVDNIIKTNRYYARAETVVDAENLEGLFPVEDWEFLIGQATPIGVLADNLVRRPTLPPSPGEGVEEMEPGLLARFLGFKPNGINLGQVIHHEVPVRLSLTRMFQKHVAILAMSGAGKSYLTAVLLEELLSRQQKDGRVATVVFDVHGEYAAFAEKPPADCQDFSNRAVAVRQIRIPAASLSAGEIALFLPGMTPVQQMELNEVVRSMEGSRYTFKELAEVVQGSKIKPQTKAALSRGLMNLHMTGLFGSEEQLTAKREGEKAETYRLRDLLVPGQALIFDLSGHIDTKRKQIIALWAAKQIFRLRRQAEIPPVIMFVEEAHNFIPEGVSRELAPAKSIFRTIAREGRKFLCSLVVISQRPIKLDTTVLSQCNTHIIMRITNPYDKDHIGKGSEGITVRTLNSLTTLQVGEALITGEAVRCPIFMRVRLRTSWEKKATDMETDAVAYENSMARESKKLEAVNDAFL
ncbi:MAG TPA: ATP-binding protein [archaeon]|nr:ATP-binding protein [archaeon]